MHQFEWYTKCALCDKPADDEIHLTPNDIAYEKDMYKLYEGERKAGLLYQYESYEEMTYGDAVGSYKIEERDVDFIRDELRNK